MELGGGSIHSNFQAHSTTETLRLLPAQTHDTLASRQAGPIPVSMPGTVRTVRALGLGLCIVRNV